MTSFMLVQKKGESLRKTSAGFLIIILLSSCGASHYLRRAEQLIKKAEARGAKWSSSTSFQKIPVTVPGITFSTTLSDPDWRDTIYLRGKDSIQVKLLRIPATPKEPERIYVQADCPPQTTQATVPVTTYREIKAGYTLWDLIILGIVCFCLGWAGNIVRLTIKEIISRRAKG